MAEPGYVSLTAEDLVRMERAERDNPPVDKWERGEYSVGQIEVLPAGLETRKVVK